MTNDRLANPLIRDYLRDLEKEASLLPRRLRGDLIAEIRGHLHEGLSSGAATDTDVRNLLTSLGDPHDIVAAARSEVGATNHGLGLREVAAILLLLVGGIIPPLIGWFIGVALLWSSNAWTSGQKLLGTLVIPGGLLLPVLMLSLTTPGTLAVWVSVPLLVVLVVGPFAVAAYLWQSARRSQ